MLDICLLGTGGMMPLPYRWLTSMMARYNGTGILIDCGEGTQIALKEKGCDAYYFGSFAEIESFCMEKCQKGDLLITMGAGDVVNIGENLLK